MQYSRRPRRPATVEPDRLAAGPRYTGSADGLDRPDRQLPYDDDDDYTLMAKRADLHCEEQCGRDAVLVDRDLEGSGFEATFRCE